MDKKIKPFSKIELKMLVFNKMKRKGMSYEQAIEEVKKDIEECRKNHKKEETLNNGQKDC